MYKLNTSPISAIQDIANLAFQRPTYQRSNLDGAIASRAVDGDNSTDFSHGSCSHTHWGDVDPWWMVDLQQVHRVSTVKVTNRGDCCGECGCIFE